MLQMIGSITRPWRPFYDSSQRRARCPDEKGTEISLRLPHLVKTLVASERARTELLGYMMDSYHSDQFHWARILSFFIGLVNQERIVAAKRILSRRESHSPSTPARPTALVRC